MQGWRLNMVSSIFKFVILCLLNASSTLSQFLHANFSRKYIVFAAHFVNILFDKSHRVMYEPICLLNFPMKHQARKALDMNSAKLNFGVWNYWRNKSDSGRLVLGDILG